MIKIEIQTSKDSTLQAEINRARSQYLVNYRNGDSSYFDFICPVDHDFFTMVGTLIAYLLISDKIPSVTCKFQQCTDDDYKTIFQSITTLFLEQYPNGIYDYGATIIRPQIEIFQPTGDICLIEVSLGSSIREAIKRHE